MIHFITLAFKNIFRQKKRSLTLGVNYSFVTFVLVLLLAFSTGATRNIRNNLIRASAGHITITGQYVKEGRVYLGIPETSKVVELAKNALGNAEILARYQVRSAMYYKGLSKMLLFVGIDTIRDTGYRDQMTFLAGSWDRFVGDPNGVLLPKDIASYYGLELGDETVLSTRSRFGAFNTGILKVEGIYTTNNFFANGAVLTHFDFLRRLDLSGSNTSSTLYVYLKHPNNVDEKRNQLMSVLKANGFQVSRPTNDAEAISVISSASTKYQVDESGNDRVELRVATINEVLGIVRSVLKAVNAVGAVITAIMLFIIAISIFINLRMTINERLREIGTMRAIGMESGGVTLLFVFENIILSLLFTAVGVVAAVGVSLLFRYLIVLPSAGNLGLFLDMGHFVLIPTIGGIALVVAITTLSTALFAFFPARKGGKITPVEALNKVF